MCKASVQFRNLGDWTRAFLNNMKGDGAAPGGSAPKAASAVDERFSAVHTDPRFQRFPRKQRHVEIDERFAGQYC